MTTVKFMRSRIAIHLNAFQLVEDAHIDQNMWYALLNVINKAIAFDGNI
jgi:hypothetical protein